MFLRARVVPWCGFRGWLFVWQHRGRQIDVHRISEFYGAYPSLFRLVHPHGISDQIRLSFQYPFLSCFILVYKLPRRPQITHPNLQTSSHVFASSEVLSRSWQLSSLTNRSVSRALLEWSWLDDFISLLLAAWDGHVSAQLNCRSSEMPEWAFSPMSGDTTAICTRSPREYTACSRLKASGPLNHHPRGSGLHCLL